MRTNPLGIHAAALFLALTLGGCSEADPSSHGGLDGFPVELELVHVIDGEEHVFGHVGAVAADDHGRVFVLDTQALEIAVIDPVEGTVERYGGSGSAPGEFLALQSTLAWTGEALVAADWRSGRLTYFDPTGAVTATKDWRASGVVTQVPTTLFAAGGTLYGVSRAPQPFQPINWADPPAEVPPPQFSYMRMDSLGSPTPTALPEHLSPVPWPPEANCGTSNGVIHILSHAFASGGPLVAFTPAGVVAAARRDSWTIELLDPTTGAAQGQIQREVALVRVTDEDWEAQPEIQKARAIEQEFGPLRGQGGTPCAIFEARPQVQPSIRTLISDESGRLWVESVNTSGFALTILDAAGEVLGESRMPARDRRIAPYARGNRLYVVIQDDLGVQSIEVYEARFGN